ncbi:hypothetical protein Godav_008350 [Gossypium davidsonii]|uniref:Auxin response factor n=1 Tax=Gossypium davidsonii TaxID=34287 RepID=A0A7J8S9P1_GOSDV|nr:hypothetical protein [Gossypium davidsonii]
MRKEAEKSLDPQLWHACAGSMVQIPPVNSKVFYFPQGHAEHSLSPVDFSSSPPIPALVLCRVASVKFLADAETDEVYAKIMLVPLPNTEPDLENVAVLGGGSDNVEKPASFAKTLTQSDANNGGGFSVPRYCAETIFPRLDYTADPPVQTVIARDVHGEIWKFRHIYRGTPRRHLLTTGWSSFVNHKKLVAGDSIVFLRAENGELCVGIRRAKRGNDTGAESGLGNGNYVSPYGGFSGFFKEDESKITRKGNPRGKGKVRAEAVVEAVGLAANGQPFEIVTWDEPDLLQNVERVSPWLVELVPNMLPVHLSPFSTVTPRKKLRLPEHLDFPLVEQFPMPSFSGHPLRSSNPLCCLSDNAPAGIQGARHAQVRLSSSDPHLNKLKSGLFPSGFQLFDPQARVPNGISMTKHTDSNDDNLSCLLTVGNSSPKKKSENGKRHQFLLFGQPILTEQQLSRSCSTGVKTALENEDKRKDYSNGSGSALENQLSPEKSFTTRLLWQQDYQAPEPGSATGHCKVFLESEDVGRTLDLTVLGSYEELYMRLANMFGRERSEMLGHVLYRDATGAVKQTGDEPFSTFMKTVKRLNIRMDSRNDTDGRSWLTGIRTAKNRLEGPNKRGPLSIFA